MKTAFAILTLVLSFQLNAQMFNLPKNYMPIGINAGGGGSGGVFGGELSFVHAGDRIGYGLFIDVLRNKNGSRIFAGPEIFIPSNNSSIILGLEAGGVTNTKTNKSGFMLGLFIPYYVIPYFR
ncbi:MAG TPA: hypothetical protein PLE16_12020, partial [Spirochaetota bacterium]|nr:hypothetical protein [Spirochaetota bacterium]